MLPLFRIFLSSKSYLETTPVKYKIIRFLGVFFNFNFFINFRDACLLTSFTPRRDHFVISLHNANTLLSIKEMSKRKISVRGLTANSQRQNDRKYTFQQYYGVFLFITWE